MKAYLITVLVIDNDNIGPEEAASVIDNANYPNDCIWPRSQKTQVFDIGDWHDHHPLNFESTDCLAWLSENAIEST